MGCVERHGSITIIPQVAVALAVWYSGTVYAALASRRISHGTSAPVRRLRAIHVSLCMQFLPASGKGKRVPCYVVMCGCYLVWSASKRGELLLPISFTVS